jgi:nitrogen regulatory protein P-II 2
MVHLGKRRPCCPEIARPDGAHHQFGAERRPRPPLGPDFGPFARGTVSALKAQRRSRESKGYAHRPVTGIADSESIRPKMQTMKMISAVVRPFKLDELRNAIAQLGVQGVTVTEVHELEFGPRSKVEIAIDDAITEPVLEAIANVSRTGRPGDGRILLANLEQAIRIRTGETGTSAT